MHERAACVPTNRYKFSINQLVVRSGKGSRDGNAAHSPCFVSIKPGQTRSTDCGQHMAEEVLDELAHKISGVLPRGIAPGNFELSLLNRGQAQLQRSPPRTRVIASQGERGGPLSMKLDCPERSSL